ncbi:MAG: hypothetical protein ACYC3F_09260 [Gemmatimonadaceae bacterium]
MRAPSFVDHLFNLGFFVVMNSVLLGGAWLKARRARGHFRWLFYLAVAPLVVMVWSLSWQWLFDVTAANLWPLGMMMLAVPCWIAWLFLARMARRPQPPSLW